VEYQHYDETAQRVSELVDAGECPTAVTLLQSLRNSDIADLDKSKMCVNRAIVCDRMGQAKDALAWYDEGLVFGIAII